MARDADRRYKDFIGKDADVEYDVELSPMDELTYLGKVEAIEYIARKHRDRKVHIYRHEFEKKPILATNGYELVIIGRHIRITTRGIEG